LRLTGTVEDIVATLDATTSMKEELDLALVDGMDGV
jgi:hypothetical protein